MMAFAPLIYIGGYKLLGYVGGKVQKAVAGQPKHMMPDEQVALLKKYSESLGFAGGVTTEAFDSYAGKRISCMESFAKILAPDGKPINEKLKDPTAADLLKDLNKSLELSDVTKEQQKEFNAAISTINKMISDLAVKFTPGDMVDYLHGVKDSAHKAIVAQHTAETKALTAQLEKPAVDKLRDALGATDDQMAEIAKQMRTNLKTSQDKELATFDKNVNDSITKLHESAQQERDRVTYLATLYENNANMRTIIDKAAAARDAAEEGVQVEFDATNLKVRFKGIKIEDLPLLEAVSGRKIEMDKNGSFSMQLPRRWTSPFYYSDWKSKLKEDMMSIAQAVKAAGFKYVTMTADHPDPEHALQLAKAAYAAARESGYPADKITVEVNGKKMSAKEIFKDSPSELHAIDGQARLNDQKRSHFEKSSTITTTQKSFKETVTNYREEDRLKEEAKKQVVTVPTSTAARQGG